MGWNLLLWAQNKQSVEAGGRQDWKKGRRLGPFRDVLESISSLVLAVKPPGLWQLAVKHSLSAATHSWPGDSGIIKIKPKIITTRFGCLLVTLLCQFITSIKPSVTTSKLGMIFNFSNTLNKLRKGKQSCSRFHSWVSRTGIRIQVCPRSPGSFYGQSEESQGEGEASSRPPIQDQELFNLVLIMLGPDVGPFPATLHIMLYDNSLFIYMEGIWSCLRNVDLF